MPMGRESERRCNTRNNRIKVYVKKRKIERNLKGTK